MEEQETKQVAVSSVEAEYCAMATTSKELAWLKNFLP